MPNNSWLEFVKEFRKKNPGYSYKDALKRCKELKQSMKDLENEGFKDMKLIDKTKVKKKLKKLRDDEVIIYI